MDRERAALHEFLVGAAGKVEPQPAPSQIIEKFQRAVNQKSLARRFATANRLDPRSNAPIETAQIFLLIPQRVLGSAASLANPLGKLDHLINRLLAVEPHDVVDGLAEVGRALASGPRLALMDLLSQGERSVDELASAADLVG